MKSINNMHRRIKTKSYCVFTLLFTIILTVLIYFHAVVSFFNVVIAVIFMVYFNKFHKNKARKPLRYSYVFAMLCCNLISVLVAILIVTALLATIGTNDFWKLIKTLWQGGACVNLTKLFQFEKKQKSRLYKEVEYLVTNYDLIKSFYSTYS